MLSFIDESYQEVSKGLFFTTYSAVCLARDGSRDFSRDLCNLKRIVWKIDDPTEKELKGSLLLTERALTMPKNREYVTQLLALMREHEAKAFAVVCKGPLATLKGHNQLPQAFQYLIERVNLYASEATPGAKAAMIFDSIEDKSNRNIAKAVTNFLYRHGFGKTLDHILDFPLFGDSLTTPGLQMADLVAYCVNSRYAGRRGYLEDVFVGLKGLTKDWHDRRGDGATDFGIRFMDYTGNLPGITA